MIIEEHISKTHSVHFLSFSSYLCHIIPYMHIYCIHYQTVPKLTETHEINQVEMFVKFQNSLSPQSMRDSTFLLTRQ